jgi:cobalt-precorrin 5A hydrolase
VSDVLGIWPVRVEAVRLAERLMQQLGGELFRPWEQPEGQKVQFQDRFTQHSQWVLIMATGIAVRFIAGLVKSKYHDPAVVVLDEAGRYAIALLGGHEAGANALAYRVANATGAVPVVTTATEATKPLIVGVGCRKGVTEEQIERAVRHALAQVPPAELDASDRLSGSAPPRAKPRVLLTATPKVPGIDADLADEFESVRELVTVDLKADEPALQAFSRRHAIPLRIIARQQIEARSWVTQPSEWVRKSVGLDGVCEPCALIACGRGRLVVPKTTLDGVAVAVVEDDWELVS